MTDHDITISRELKNKPLFAGFERVKTPTDICVSVTLVKMQPCSIAQILLQLFHMKTLWELCENALLKCEYSHVFFFFYMNTTFVFFHCLNKHIS